MTHLRPLLLAVLLCAFGCQETVDSGLEIVKYAQVSGQGYNSSPQDFDWNVPDGEYIEPRVSYQDLVFLDGTIERRVFADLCRTKIAANLCSEIYYKYHLFTVIYQEMEVDEGVELLVFFGNGGSAEFDDPESGFVYPDAIQIQVSSQLLSDGGITVPQLEKMPDSIYDYAREYFETHEPQGEPDEYDAIL